VPQDYGRGTIESSADDRYENAMSLFVIWLHVVAAAVWVGGMIFIAAVLVPVVRSPEFAKHAGPLVKATGRRFRGIGWFVLGVLVVTGFLNLAYRGIGPAEWFSAELWATPFGRRLAVKLALVAVVLAVSGVHDFSIGPRAGRAVSEAPGSPEALALRRRASLLGRFNLILGLVIVGFGVVLARGCA
jgi:uncharacterized membrane protein